MPIKRTEDKLRAEAERKSKNLWKVYNPTNQDVTVTLNAKINPEVWTMKSREESIIPFYVAEMYIDKMIDKIIYAKSDTAVIKENERRMKQGFNAMNVHTEQFRFESKNLKTLMGRKDKLRTILIVGLHKEYGVDKQVEVDPADKQRQVRELETDTDVDEALGKKEVEPAKEPEKAPEKPAKVAEATPEVPSKGKKKPKTAKKAKNE